MDVLRSKSFSSYIKRLLIVAAVLCVISIGYNLLTPLRFQNPFTFYLLGFFFLVMASSHYFVVKTVGVNIQKLIRVYMISAVSRLFIYLMIILAYIFKNPQGILNFVLTFFVFYVVFTSFEVKEMTKTFSTKP